MEEPHDSHWMNADMWCWGGSWISLLLLQSVVASASLPQFKPDFHLHFTEIINQYQNSTLKLHFSWVVRYTTINTADVWREDITVFSLRCSYWGLWNCCNFPVNRFIYIKQILSHAENERSCAAVLPPRVAQGQKAPWAHRMVLLHGAPHPLPHLRRGLRVRLAQLHYHLVDVAFGGLQQTFHGGPEIIRFGKVQNRNNRKRPREIKAASDKGSRWRLLWDVKCPEIYLI